MAMAMSLTRLEWLTLHENNLSSPFLQYSKRLKTIVFISAFGFDDIDFNNLNEALPSIDTSTGGNLFTRKVEIELFKSRSIQSWASCSPSISCIRTYRFTIFVYLGVESVFTIIAIITTASENQIWFKFILFVELIPLFHNTFFVLHFQVLF